MGAAVWVYDQVFGPRRLRVRARVSLISNVRGVGGLGAHEMKSYWWLGEGGKPKPRGDLNLAFWLCVILCDSESTS